MNLTLVQDTHFLLEKAKIVAHLTDELHDLGTLFKEHPAAKALPEEVVRITPKVSRGENYKGLPYLVLDYPRMFGKPDTCAIRVFFWWGHFVSVNLYLAGTYLIDFLPNIGLKAAFLPPDILMSMEASPWEHDVDQAHVVFASIPWEQVRVQIETAGFLKLSRRLSLTDIGQLTPFSIESFETLASLLA